MGLFNLSSKGIAIDLGTANTLIMYNDQIVLNEPSIIAIDSYTGKMVALGREAMDMHEKTPDRIKTIKPLRDGVISNFQAAEQMIRGMIQKINTGKKSLISMSKKMIICIPYCSTEVEKRAVRDSAEHAGAHELYMIHEPIAAAMGLGININDPEGSMIIDMGGGTTEIAVICLSGVVCNQSLKVAGNTLNKDIMDYVKRAHNLLIGERTAEQIKIQIGSAVSELENPPSPMKVVGRDLMTGLPKELLIGYQEIAEAIDKTISMIEDAVIKTLEKCPPELSGDIGSKGLYITGGGSGLKGLAKRIEKRTQLKVQISEHNMLSVVRGTAASLKNIKGMQHILLK